MSFGLMDVFVKIGADTSELEGGINKSQGLLSGFASGIGGAVSTGMQVVGTAVSAATAAVGAFAASSVSVGSTFDSSMAQVAATMGKSVGEIGELRQYAQDMGATTAFSATQAADALNYMALAGYDADQSMSMLPNVLNLASAGNMDLARASDMVTDAQSALGLEMEDMVGFVDQMAKTASSSNTSVTQLGDAILTVGGTAKTLSGGTTELNTALGILADNGIKGAEGGTKLRNVILSLSAPTDKAASMLQSLGVTTTDVATGDLLPLEDIMAQLGDSLDGLGTAERADIISTLFNKQDIAAVNALLDTSSDRWEELSSKIDDSAGAAKKMADTQLDNLAGDVTLFKSALEGAQILVSDQLTPTLRDFVQFGTSGITEISEAFKEGGLTGAMDAFGKVLSDGLNMIIEMLPTFIDAGMQLLGALGQGILENLPTLLDAAVQIVTQISQGLMEAAPYLLDGVVQIIETLGKMLIENLPSMVSHIAEMVTGLAQMISDNATGIVSGAIQLITVLATSLLENLPTILGAVLDIVLAIAKALIDNAPQLLLSLAQILLQLGKAMGEWNVEILKKVGQFFIDILKKFNDWDKDVKTAVGNFFKDIFDKLKTWIEQDVVPKVSSFFSDILTKLGTWLTGDDSLTKKITKFFDDIFESLKTWIDEKVVKKVTGFFGDIVTKLAEWLTGTDSLTKKVTTFFDDIYNKLKTWFDEQIVKKISGFFTQLITDVKTWLTGEGGVTKKVEDFIKGILEKLTTFVTDLGKKASDAAKEFSEKLINGVKDLPSKFFEVGSNIVSGIWEGIKSGWDWLTDAVSDLANSLFDAAKSALGISSPSKKFMWIGEMTDKGLTAGLEKYSGLVDKAMEDITTVPDVNMGDIYGNGGGTTNTANNNVVINVYGAVGQDVNELAEIISRKIDGATGRRMVAMGVA